MTISSTVRKAGPFDGTGSQTEFPFEFKVFSAGDLYVVQYNEATEVETVLELDSDYTVTLNADQDNDPGGTIELTSALAVNYTLTITSSLANLQPTDLTNRGGFYPSVINDALDRACIQIQQLQDDTDRTLKTAVSVPDGVDNTLPMPAANMVIGWDNTGVALKNWSVNDLVTSVAYGSAKADIFTGDGETVDFYLELDPASINNLDVSVGGVCQVPVDDYTWTSGTKVTFTTAPPDGETVLIRYMQALPTGTVTWANVYDAPFIDKYVYINQDTTITTAVNVLEGGMFIISSGKTLTINGPFSCGLFQCFDGAGSVIGLKKVRPEWFGHNSSPGVTDMTTSIQKAIDCVNDSGGGSVLFHANYYKITDSIKLYSNIRYQGEGTGSMYPSSSTPNRGATLVWAGDSAFTTYMVTAYNTWHVVWDGISLVGDWAAGSSSECRGFNIATDVAHKIDANSQRNYFSNFSIQACKYGMSFGASFDPSVGNTDGWVVEKFIIDNCQNGFYLNCENIAYSEIRNGFISVHNAGIWINYAGWTKLSSLGFFGMSPTGTNGMILISENSGIVLIENSQGEQDEEAGSNYSFVEFYGGINTNPVTLIGNAVHMKIVVGATQKALTFIGNRLESPVYLNANDSNICSISNYQKAGNGFTFVGTNNHLSNNAISYGDSVWIGDGSGTWTPRLFQGTTEITSPTTAVGTWTIQGSVLHFNCYFVKNSGAPSASGTFTIQGLPYYSATSGISSVNAAGEVTINGVNYAINSPHFFYIGDNSTTLVLAGGNSSTSWTTGQIVMRVTGTYQLPAQS